MRGTALSDARRALRLALNALPPSATFNVISFGSEFSRLFGDARRATAANVAAAKEHVAALDANYGASELWRPLQALLLLAEHRGDEQRTGLLRRDSGNESGSTPPPKRQLVLLTDGH
eukprot:2211115-Prymnesium_polylepis.1